MANNKHKRTLVIAVALVLSFYLFGLFFYVFSHFLKKLEQQKAFHHDN